jgi:hypothetical protein
MGRYSVIFECNVIQIFQELINNRYESEHIDSRENKGEDC